MKLSGRDWTEIIICGLLGRSAARLPAPASRHSGAGGLPVVFGSKL